MTSPLRATGHIPDTVTPYAPVSELIGAPLQEDVEWNDGVLPWAPTPEDQGDEESCVGEATSSGLYCAMGVHGLIPVRPSAKAIWYFARNRMGNAKHNIGCRPADAFLTISEVGYPAATAWPRSKPHDERPPQSVMWGAADQETVETYRIFSYNQTRINELKTALVRKCPAPLAIRIDAAYQANTDGRWFRGGDDLGWHYVLGTHFDSDGLWTLGSYGQGHGRSGYVLVPWADISNPFLTTDINPIRFAPAPEAA
jgi:hypothetical protein